ncbi:MAG: RNA-binding protein [Bacteroidales bacterium]|nr:RNA-binding protein [Bacteroidales bacterium]
MNIYVGNLDFKVNENDLNDIFGEYGSVSEARIIKDKFSSRSKGFGFVTMNDAAEANKAISELNGATFENREMVVNEAREKTESNDRSNYRSNNNRRY